VAALIFQLLQSSSVRYKSGKFEQVQPDLFKEMTRSLQV
jgi:hypothetical protein